jgi:hypothetical protein
MPTAFHPVFQVGLIVLHGTRKSGKVPCAAFPHFLQKYPSLFALEYFQCLFVIAFGRILCVHFLIKLDQFIVDKNLVNHESDFCLCLRKPGPHALDGINGFFVMRNGLEVFAQASARSAQLTQASPEDLRRSKFNADPEAFLK